MRPFYRTVTLIVCLAWVGTALAPAAHAAAVKGKARKPRMVLYAPTTYDRVAVLLHKGKEQKYYLFSRENPAKLELQGPTTLAVNVRLLYDVAMKGAQNFTIAVEENGMLGKRSEVASYSFTAQKSPVSTFKGEAEVVPSKAQKFKLEVPSGIHRYTISLRNTAASAAAIRILIPKKDINPAPQPAPKEKQK